MHCAALLLAALVVADPSADAGNRLTYVDASCDPYYVGLETPKLTTPQWVGEPGVEAVIVLANDDLREPAAHESVLRPVFDRLKGIDGRAGMSLMTNKIDTQHPLVPKWLAEGINLEVHTTLHRCPCLQGGDLKAAKQSFDGCLELVAGIAGNHPVAFRMPCCDSMNSVSPRYFAEIINKTTGAGHFLTIDSSVFHLFTPHDPALTRGLVLDEAGRERFRPYVPADRLMVNLIEDYPYPYVIGGLCWEVPCLMPSDWDAQHRNGKCSPDTIRDWKAGIDATVAKQGAFSLCFHTHGWIAPEQVVELIDYAVKRHGGKVKFLNFREVQERLDKNLLGGQPLRAANGQDNGVRLLDVNNDGFMDVVIGNGHVRQTRIWSPDEGKWITTDFPVTLVAVDKQGDRHDAGVRFGVLQKSGYPSFVVRNGQTAGLWHFDGQKWIADPDGLKGLEADGPVYTARNGRDGGVRLRDLDLDGVCELIVGNGRQNAVFRWVADEHRWTRLPFKLPGATAIVDDRGRDVGLRFADVDEDGHADVVFSNAQRYGLYLFTSMTDGWGREVLSGKRGDANELPMIVRADGTNNGAWFGRRHLWVQNEDTGKLPGQVQSRSYAALLGADQEPATTPSRPAR